METALTPVLAPLETLPGVEGKRKKLFQRLLGPKVIDALLHLPTNVIQYTPISSIAEAPAGKNIIINVHIVTHHPNTLRGKPYKIIASDGTHSLEIVYFNAIKPYLLKLYPVGSEKVLMGKIDQYHSHYTMAHPEGVFDPKNSHHLPTHEVIYPLATGITNKCILRVIHQALSRLPSLKDWLDSSFLAMHGWPSFCEAILACHNPKTLHDITLQSKARQRLAFDEFLSHQLGLQLARQYNKRSSFGLSQIGNGKLISSLLKILPFKLTSSQEHVLQEIFRDMANPFPMSRLVQGDVGSGKTIVALLAMLKAIESGNQAAILAPTDLLARQHAETILKLVEPLPIKAAILTGREKGKQKAAILEQLSDGTIHLIIGTHALIQEKVSFKKLGLAVIDEQHRFGVEQRLDLSTKGQYTDVLAMTATPIPRTLQLAQYGDMDVSIIDQKPAGRLPVTTTVLSLTRLEEVITAVTRVLKEGTKVFWVCPLVKESEALDLSAAEERYESLKSLFGEKVGLVHGQMKAQEKDKVMEGFINQNIDILIATTVIEVGVNIPSATIMIIEHAERFGLAQLHQLRGRIGRGNKAGSCILLYGKQLSEVGKKRLAAMREISDGFKIAEIDLELRGGGDVLGTRQSGMPGFKIANFLEYPEISKSLLALANKYAKRICEEDPFLKGPHGEPIKFLLRFFGREEAMRYTRS